MARLSKEQVNEIIDLYVSGENSTHLSQIFGVSPTAICAVLKRNGISRRTQNQCQKKYDVNESAFNIPTPEMLYWLGFLYADGTVSEQSRQLAVTLKCSDFEHLNKLKAFLKSTHPLLEISQLVNGTQCKTIRLTVTSKPLIANLCSLGMNLKSLDRVCPVDFIESRDFWRGVIDGDGHLGIGKRRKLEVVGGFKLMSQFLDYIKSITKTSTTVLSNKNIYRIMLIDNNAGKVVQTLYLNNDVALERKEKIAKEFMTF